MQFPSVANVKVEMRKILALLPLTAFAACGSVDIHLGEYAGAGEGGSGGASSSSSSTSGTSSSGSPDVCNCERDGTRLKAQWIVGEDGSRMFGSAWLDTELNDKCWFQFLSNGETRCVPAAATITTYEDAACSIPVYGVAGCGLALKYGRVETKEPFVPGACGQKVTKIDYVNIDYGFPVDLQVWYTIDASGTCAQGNVPAGTKLYKTNPLASSSWFVLATEGEGF